MKTLLALTAYGLLSGAPFWFSHKKGDIVPVATHGVNVVEQGKDHHKAAVCDLDNGSLTVALTTSAGFLFLDITIENKSDHTITVSPAVVSLLSNGGEIDPLDPEAYIHDAYTTPPYEIDDKGEIRDDKEKGKMIPYTPGDTPGGSLAERMAATDMEKHSSRERMKVTKELLALKKDPLSNRTQIEPGKSIKGRRIHQRNGLELPLMVKFKSEIGRVTVRFEREK